MLFILQFVRIEFLMQLGGRIARLCDEDSPEVLKVGTESAVKLAAIYNEVPDYDWPY